MGRVFSPDLQQAKATIRGAGTVLTRNSAAKSGPLPGAHFHSGSGGAYKISSPNSEINVTLKKSGQLSYSVDFNGKEVVSPSKIGLKVAGGIEIGGNITLGEPSALEFNEDITERGRKINDHHVACSFPVRENESGLEFSLEFRLWNDAAAFRLVFQKSTDLLISEETTTFNMPVESVCRYQTDYEKLQNKTLEQKSRYLPEDESFAYSAMFELPENGGFALLAETNLVNYPGAALLSKGRGSFGVDYWDSGSFFTRGAITPWRMIILCKTLQELSACNAVNLSAEPEEIIFENNNWIQPGKSAWSFFTDENERPRFERIMEYNAKAKDLGLDYNLIDSGWNRWLGIEPLSLLKIKKIVADAKEKDIGIWIWKSAARGMKYKHYRKMFFKVCRSIGVKGIKIDHIEDETQAMVKLYRAILKDAAEQELMVIFHNPQKPTGLSRTYPNLLSMEAIRGFQTGCDPDDSVILPFTRCVLGDADATPFCFSMEKIRGGATLSHMLAHSVIVSSAFLTVSEDASLLQNHTIAPFIKALPVVWDESVCLPQTVLGDTAAFAKRRGSLWFVAMMNSGKGERAVSLDLPFLENKKVYSAEIYFDDLENSSEIYKQVLSIGEGEKFDFVMKSGGGFAGIIREEIF